MLCLIIFTNANSVQAHLVKISIDELTEKSEYIISGEIVDVEHKWDKEFRLIYSFNTLLVKSSEKGRIEPGERITIISEGGQAIDPFTNEPIFLWVEDEPVFEKGNTVKLYLEQLSSDRLRYKALDETDRLYRPYAAIQGVIPLGEDTICYDDYDDYFYHEYYNYDSKTDYKSLASSNTPVITGITPNIVSAGTDSIVTIRGNNFGSNQGNKEIMFHFRTEGTTRRFMSSEVKAWSNERIDVIVPTKILTRVIGGDEMYHYSAGSGPLAFFDRDFHGNDRFRSFYPFTATFGYGGIRWDDDEIEYVISDTFNQEQRNAIIAAAETWNNASVYLNLLFDGTTDNLQLGRNNENQVTFENLPAGVLGRARNWNDGNYIIESDFAFSTNFTWSALETDTCPSDSFDLQSIAVHEFGHWLLLLDLYG